MNKTEMWNILCERHPEFKDEEYVLKQRARGLKKLIEQAWDEGHAAGKLEAKEKHLGAFEGLFRNKGL